MKNNKERSPRAKSNRLYRPHTGLHFRSRLLTQQCIITTLLVFMGFTVQLQAQSFSAVSPSGHTLKYNVVNTSQHAVEVAPFQQFQDAYGDLIIPATVTDSSGLTYTVTTIGSYAFYCCPLTSVVISDGITTISDHAFVYCGGLTAVTIPNSVTTIRNGAFYLCNNRSLSITVPNTVTTIDESAFADVRNVVYNGTATGSPWAAYGVNGYMLDSNSYVEGIFAYVDNTKTFLLACLDTSVTGVNIPSTVTTIGPGAFEDCNYLSTVTIPNTVTTIGNYAFRNCHSLFSVTIPSTVTAIIGGGAFSQVKNIIYHGAAEGEPWGALNFNGYVDGIFIFADNSETVLRGCRNIATSVTIPNSVVTIDRDALRGCDSITMVNIPNSVVRIESGAFCDCHGLTAVTLSDSLTSIGDDAFRGCTSLLTIDIPNSVSYLGQHAFFDCRSLTTVRLPDSITYIDNGLFGDCHSLSSITIPNTVTRINDGAFQFCSSLTSITIPDAVTYLGPVSFHGTSLSTVVIPNAVDTIEKMAFVECRHLTSVTIGNAVSYIGSEAFGGCDDLRQINLLGTPPQLNRASDLGPNVRRVVVPCEYDSLYHAAAVWNTLPTLTNDCRMIMLNAMVSNNAGGYVEGPGMYRHGDTVTLTVVPADGYHFVRWNDSVTANPRTLVIDTNTTYADYVAYVAIDSLTVSLTTNNTRYGQVSGSGTYAYGTSLTVTATPVGDAIFVKWSDNMQDNPRTMVVRHDLSLSALFVGTDTVMIHDTTIMNHYIHDTTVVTSFIHDTTVVTLHDTTVVNNYIHDTTLITHTQYDTVTLTQYDTTVVDNYIYDTITLTLHDTTVVDNYIYDTVTLTQYDTTVVDNYIYDTITLTLHDTTVVDNYIYDTVTLTQYDTTVVTNYIHDTTVVTNTQYDTVTLTQYDTTIVNNYIHDTTVVTNTQYDTITLTQYDTTVVTNYIHDTTVVTNTQYDTITLTQYDTTVVTNYIHDTTVVTQYDTTIVNNYIHDTTVVTLHDTTVVTNTVFDTVTMTQYDTVMQPLTYYTLSVASANMAHGLVAGNGTFPDSTEVEIAAIPLQGYRFQSWQDGNTDNPRLVLLTGDITYTASFDEQVGVLAVDAVNYTIGTDDLHIVVRGAEGQRIRIFDNLGRLLSNTQSTEGVRVFTVPTSGVYMVQVGNDPARKVVVVR